MNGWKPWTTQYILRQQARRSEYGKAEFNTGMGCGPFGAVKEQSSGLYAQKMAELGFLTIAFDPSYTGESGGMPRYVASPTMATFPVSFREQITLSFPSGRTPAKHLT